MSTKEILHMMNSGFNYYEPLKLQSSIEDQTMIEVSTINALQANTPFEFFVMGGEGSTNFLDLANSYFIFKVKVLTEADAAPVDADEISCVQNLAHSMFQRIELFANDKLINDANGLYPYRAMFTDLLSRNSDAQQNWMKSQGWIERDVAGSMEVFRSTGNATSKHAVARQAEIGTGQVKSLYMRPHLELFNSDKFIPPGIRIKVRFTPAPNNFILKRGAGNTVVKVVITDAKFYLRMVKATTEQAASYYAALTKIGPAKIRMTRVTLKHMTVAAGATSATLDNLYLGPVPNRIILAMVRESALTGTLDQNPYNFQHFGANQIGLLVNGKNIPNPPYSPNWTPNDYKREYIGTLQAVNKAYTESPVVLTEAEFKAGYSVFVFDLTPDHNSPDSLSDQGQGSVRVLLRFAAGLQNTIAVILYAEYDTQIEIDKYNQVTGNF